MEIKPRRVISESLKKLVIRTSTPIVEVIEIIDQSSTKIALAINESGKLIGTITDGDIRRGILKGISLGDKASLVMNRKPRTAQKHQTRKSILEKMKQKQIYQMPVVDESGNLIRVEVMTTLLQPKVHDNRVVLMVGGMGTRLRPLTDSIPKPLLSVGKKPILEIILENFIDQGFKKFYLSVNYKHEIIKAYFQDGKKWGADIQYLEEDTPLGTVGALSLLKEAPQESLFVMNGDLLTKINFMQLLQFHRENKAQATMCVREYHYQVPYGVIYMNRHIIRSIEEKPTAKHFVNAGIYILEPPVIKKIPRNKRFDMTQLFDLLIKKKQKTAAFPIREYWIDIGHLEDFERAKGEYNEVFK